MRDTFETVTYSENSTKALLSVLSKGQQNVCKKMRAESLSSQMAIIPHVARRHTWVKVRMIVHINMYSYVRIC